MKKKQTAILFSILLNFSFFVVYSQPLVMPSENADWPLTCCYHQISAINCDMVEINDGRKLWAAVYSGFDAQQNAVAMLTVWRDYNSIATVPIGTAYGDATAPDVVITHAPGGLPGNDYLVCVVFACNNDIYYETYAVSLSGGPSLSQLPITSVKVNNPGICNWPHIDAFADRYNRLHNGPLLSGVAIAWSQKAPNGYHEILCTLSDDMVNMNAITVLSNDSAMHSDIAASTWLTASGAVERSVYAIVTHTPSYGNTPVKLYRADYDFSAGTALSVTPLLLDNTHHHAFQPRIEAQNLFSAGTGIPWQAAVQVSDPQTPLNFYVALFNDNVTNDVCQLNPLEKHGSVAIAGRGKEGCTGVPGNALGRDYFTVGYYSTYTHNSAGNEGDFFASSVIISGKNAGQKNNYYYEICSLDMYAPVAVQTTQDNKLALATCSNTGEGLLSVWVPFETHPTTGWNLRFKLNNNQDYAFKTGVTTLTTSNSYDLYPNPASSLLHVAGVGQAVYSITDMMGRQGLSGQLSARDNRIDIAGLPAGVYTLAIRENGAGTTMKFLKQ